MFTFTAPAYLKTKEGCYRHLFCFCFKTGQPACFFILNAHPRAMEIQGCYVDCHENGF